MPASLITGGTALLGGVLSSKASKSAAKASQQAADQSTALNREIWQQTLADNEPYRQMSLGALDQYAKQFGLSVPAVRAAVSGSAPSAEAKYLQDYPDVAAEYQRNSPQGLATMGIYSPEDFARWHYQTFGEADGRNWGEPQPAVTEDSGTGAAGQTDAGRHIYGPDLPERPAIPDRPTFDRPDYAPRPETDPRQTWERPTMAPLDVSEDAYKQAPDYEVQLKEGNRNLVANRAALGGLNSGAAMKALQNYGADQALKDYGQWRDFTAGRYDTDRNFLNHDFESDRAYDADVYDSDRNFLNANWENDRNFSNANWESDRALTNSNFNTDRAFNVDLYNMDRAYDTSRYDQRNADLFGLVGLGTGANAANSAAGGRYAGNAQEALMSNATNQGNAALTGAQAWSNGISGAAPAAVGLVNKLWGQAPQVQTSASRSVSDPYGSARAVSAFPAYLLPDFTVPKTQFGF